ncbi:S41 family peptidase [Mucilaginibacter sp. UYCu711]|uniref:S41 family peptidase n=1 Tax=Mucilaginibacter sp. UYCu711 TaxID=3156339 RepID=UPI003D220572
MKTTHIIAAIFLLLTLSFCIPDTMQSIDDKVSLDLLKADFKEITFNIESKAPNPYYLCAKSSYDSIKQKITASINKPMTTIEFYQKVSPMFTLLNDEHFSLRLDEGLVKKLELQNPDLYFPFTVFIDKDKIFIDKCLREGTAVKKGDEVLSINNVPSKEILNRFRHGMLLKSNEENYFERRNEDHFYRSLFSEMGFRNNFSLKFANKTVKIKGVQKKVITALWDSIDDFTYVILNEKIGYLRINTLVADKRQKLDSGLIVFFKTLKQQRINKLIVDIRGNLGGSTKLSRDVFDYITDKKYSMDTGEEYLQNSKNVFESDTTLDAPKRMADKFIGRTILLNNVTSYSSAHMMANAFKYYKMGTVIGQISAEPLFISGEVREAITSNTKCSVYFPTKNFYLPGYEKNSASYFVPDYQVYPTINDRVKGKDPAVDLAIKILSVNR